MMQNKKIYAVTGGIGSGKTAVCRILAELGYPVFSCDAAYAELTRGGQLVDRLEEVFKGVKNADGSLNRKTLSAKVFGDIDALNKLNSITHPAIMDSLFARAMAAEGSIVFCEVPLLFENGFQSRFDGVIVIMRSLEERVNSVIERSGLKREEVTKRINAQFDYQSADLSKYYVVDNDGDMAELTKKVKKILQKIIKTA